MQRKLLSFVGAVAMAVGMMGPAAPAMADGPINPA